jgi:XTP/dITP diphosphohydrolase
LNKEIKMKFVLASSNQKKIKELRAILSKIMADAEVVTLAEAGITDDIVEDGSTFAENALIKARVAASTGNIGIADDSGLTVEALGGEPGIYSARYAGEHGNDEANNKKLLENMKGVEDRRAAFVCCIACVFPDGSEPIIAEGRVEGEILDAPRGECGFGYDPLFYSPLLGKTLAEALPEEKNAISHRGNALAAFSKAFLKKMEENK